jgi:hypothetical protein
MALAKICVASAVGVTSVAVVAQLANNRANRMKKMVCFIMKFFFDQIEGGVIIPMMWEYSI